MKLYTYRDQVTSGLPGTVASKADQFDLHWMISAILQRRRWIVAVPLVCVLLATLYVLFRSPSFTASTQLQLTNLRLTFMREDSFYAETQPDPTFLETQLQIMRSDRVAMNVLNNLQMIAPDASTSDKAAALERVRRGFSVDRAGQSNVVQIQYSAGDPEAAARMANDFARAYLAELNAARLDAAQAGSSWLRDRLREVGPKARVIAEALPPQHKTGLRGILIIAAAGMIGGLLSAAGAILWRYLDRRVVTPEEATNATGAQFLGIVPTLQSATDASTSKAARDDPKAKSFSAESPLLTYALDNPLSEAWHTLRNVTAACEDCFNGKGLRSLAVTSTFAGEGRSTIAANLAFSLVASGKRVLLVDADVYSPTLSRLFAGKDAPGLSDYLRKPEDPLASYVLSDNRTNLHFLPVGGAQDRQVRNIWTDGLSRFFQETSGAYDYVIFDIPALSMLGDIRAATRHIQGFLLVIGWRQVSAESIQVGMNAAAGLSDRLLGTVLNNVDADETRWALSPQVAFARGERWPINAVEVMRLIRAEIWRLRKHRPKQIKRLVRVAIPHRKD